MDIFEAAFAAHRANDLDIAEQGYKDALAENPAHALAHNNLGALYLTRRRFDEGAACCLTSAEIHPSAMAYTNVAAALCNLGRHTEALPFCKRALTLAPDNEAALTNLANALLGCDRFEDAISVITEHSKTHELSASMQIDLGVALWSMGLTDAALLWLNGVARSDHPRAALARYNLGMIELGRGNYEKGWGLYVARLEAQAHEHRRPRLPEWNGDPDPHGGLVVVAEQGLGDEILYLSMADELARHFEGRVYWEADTRLIPLLERSFYNRNLFFIPRTIAAEPVFEKVDAGMCIHAGHLGKFFRPSRESFAARNRAKSSWLKPPGFSMNGAKRVGISWFSANARHARRKSIPYQAFDRFVARFHAANIEIVNLQYDLTAPDPRVIQPHGDLRRDLGALAANAALCDHVVSVSNTTAHMAGAMGIQTTVLLGEGAGRFFYWGDGERTDWYAGTRVVRKQAKDDWADALDRIALDLIAQLA